jgi:hypothetical protein
VKVKLQEVIEEMQTNPIAATRRIAVRLQQHGIEVPLDQARAICEQAGFAVVPKEPTYGMVSVVDIVPCGSDISLKHYEIRDVYIQMLEAAKEEAMSRQQAIEQALIEGRFALADLMKTKKVGWVQDTALECMDEALALPDDTAERDELVKMINEWQRRDFVPFRLTSKLLSDLRAYLTRDHIPDTGKMV